MSLQLTRARRRLTVAYVGVFALILLMFGSAVLWVSTREMIAHLDESLHEAANLLEVAVETASEGFTGEAGQVGGRLDEAVGEAFGDALVDALADLNVPGRAFYVFHSIEGSLDDREGPVWLEDFARSVDGGDRYLTAEGTDEEDIEWRVYGRPLPVSGQPSPLIGVVLADFVEVEDRYPGLVRAFSLAALFSLILVGIGGSVLARTSTAPAVRAFGQLRRFTADAAHELRTPVSVIQARSEVALQSERVPEEYQAALAGILDETRRLSGTLDKLLTLARVDAGDWPVQLESLFLDDIVSDLSSSINALAAKSGVEVEVRADDECPVQGDPTLIEQLIMILVDNAVQYSSPEGQVHVSANRVGDRSILVVSDDGIGMTPDVRPLVFERFYRADPARARGGAGLGLSIAQWIASVHGAEIDLESEAGSGTTVRVTFQSVAGG